jgi:hypothetical protein
MELLHQHTNTDEGNSFKTCDDLVKLLSENGLRNTYVHQMEFIRERMINWTNDADMVRKKKKFKAELHSKKYYLLKNEDGKITGFHHSRHGKGRHLTVLDNLKGECKLTFYYDHVHSQSILTK